MWSFEESSRWTEGWTIGDVDFIGELRLPHRNFQIRDKALVTKNVVLILSSRSVDYNLDKMKVCVTLVEDEQLMELDLSHDALISDLKVALARKEGVNDPINRVRVYFKTVDDDALGKLLLSNSLEKIV